MSRLRTTFTETGRNDRRWYFVWKDGRIIWQGKAWNASEARSKATTATESRRRFGARS